MAIRIENASAQHVDSLAQIIETTFEELVPTSVLVARLPYQQVWIAVENQQVVGFVAGFVTVAQDGTQRRELDLLAVDRAAQGKGVGRQLVRAFIAGMQPPTAPCRALVAVDNQPMHRVMTACGFTRMSPKLSLFIAADGESGHEMPPDAHLIPVTTLTYRGIWVEGQISVTAIAAAHRLRKQQRADHIGALVPLTDTNAVTTCTTAGLVPIGVYHWWTLTSDAVQAPSSNPDRVES